jgi:hypothetical protein
MTVKVRFSPGVFVWGHVFQRGDLPLFIRDPAGNPASPAVVSFTLFYYPKGSSNPQQVGAANRTPVTADLGEYYVSGVSGEGGQPGDWYVRWVYQESVDSEQVEAIFPFKVFDSSQYGRTTAVSTSCGCKRRGGYAWSCRNPCACSGTTPRW